MADVVFNIAKGRVVELAKLAGTNDALIAVPLETTGLVADATMIDYDDLAALLAGASNEQTTMGRKTLTSVTVVTDDTGNSQNVDCDDITWLVATGNPVSALIICYDPDTTAGTDSNIVPLVKLDMVVTPTSSDITYVVASSGFFRAG